MDICVYLFDVSSVFSRVYKVLKKNGKDKEPNAFYKGKPIYAIQPTINRIEKEIRMVRGLVPQYTHIAMVFDYPDICFRHEIYPGYKANRPPKEQDEEVQKALLFKALQTQGYLCFTKIGVETDDSIGTISRKLSNKNILNIIFSGDKDFHQLIDKNTLQFSGRNETLFDASAVKMKFGVEPEKMLDYLTIIGDKADGITGVPGAGAKSAVQMLANNKLEDFIENPSLLDKLPIKNKNKIRQYFEQNSEQIKLTKNVVALYDDMDLNINLSMMVKKDPVDTDYLDLIVN